MVKKIVVSCEDHQELKDTVKKIEQVIKLQKCKQPKEKSGKYYKVYMSAE